MLLICLICNVEVHAPLSCSCAKFLSWFHRLPDSSSNQHGRRHLTFKFLESTWLQFAQASSNAQDKTTYVLNTFFHRSQISKWQIFSFFFKIQDTPFKENSKHSIASFCISNSLCIFRIVYSNAIKILCTLRK